MAISDLLVALDKRSRFLNRIGLGSMRRAGRRLVARGLGDEITVSVHGLSLTGTVQHREYLRRLGNHSAEPQTARLLLQDVGPGTIFVDLGAFLGVYGLEAARRGANVIAIEANNRTGDLLERNVAANRLGDMITIHHCAVGERPGTATFHVGSGDGSSDGLTEPRQGANAVEVQVRRLDDLVDDADVIKADIEGAEVQMLRGMPRLLASPRLRRMVVECNPRRLHASQSSPRELVDTLASAGFAVQAIDERAGDLFEPLGWLEAHPGRGMNLLALRSA